MTGIVVTADLIGRARDGDEQAFRELVSPYQRELQVHCYRILGSLADAEDALQETLLAAWQDLAGFEGRASIRTWLYKIATRRSLNALRSARRRPETGWPPPGLALPEPTGRGEVSWLEPYPDALLEGLPDSSPGPEACYEASEAISLAFITALQLLPPRQRAVLILRDVLGFRAREAAALLETTEESVTSALKRARAALAAAGRLEPPPPPESDAERAVLARLTRAYETHDIDGLVALLADGVLLAMPPAPLEYQGRTLAARFLAAVVFQPGTEIRLIPARANRQPAFGMYRRTPPDASFHPAGVMVLTLSGSQVSRITRFGTSLLPRFGLPPGIPG
jgi:RNA polymerase sigma-70 factor (TIGR02960 family)